MTTFFLVPMTTSGIFILYNLEKFRCKLKY